jgi:hypothetical protein
MAELSTGQFAAQCGCTLKHVNQKMVKIGITGVKSDFDKRLTMLNDEEQAELLPHINANRKRIEPEPIEPIAEVTGEIVEEPTEPFQNTALSFHVQDRESEISAFRQDAKSIALQNQSNFSAFRTAQLERVRAQARRDAGELVSVYQSEFQAVLNEDLGAVYGVDTTQNVTPSTTVKKQVGQS